MSSCPILLILSTKYTFTTDNQPLTTTTAPCLRQKKHPNKRTQAYNPSADLSSQPSLPILPLLSYSTLLFFPLSGPPVVNSPIRLSARSRNFKTSSNLPTSLNFNLFNPLQPSSSSSYLPNPVSVTSTISSPLDEYVRYRPFKCSGARLALRSRSTLLKIRWSRDLLLLLSRRLRIMGMPPMTWNRLKIRGTR